MEVLQKYNFIPFSEAIKNKLKIMLFNLKECICQLMYLYLLKLFQCCKNIFYFNYFIHAFLRFI